MFDDLDNKTTPKEPADIFSEVDKAPVAPPRPAPGMPAVGLPSQTPNLPAAAPSAAGEGKRRNWIKIAIIILVVLIILVLLAIAGRFLYSKFTHKEEIDATNMPLDGLTNEIGSTNQVTNENQPVVNTNTEELTPAANTNQIIDSDSDGLSDEAEMVLGTDPKNADTDGDGLFDAEEVNIYKTNPKNADTDGDGYKDGQEVKGGYNPNGPGRIFDVKQ
jgi:hypothetical protein